MNIKYKLEKRHEESDVMVSSTMHDDWEAAAAQAVQDKWAHWDKHVLKLEPGVTIKAVRDEPTPVT